MPLLPLAVAAAALGLLVPSESLAERSDYAVAAVLAAEAFGPAAAGVAGVYGVLMLLAGARATLTRAAGRPGRSPRRTA